MVPSRVALCFEDVEDVRLVGVRLRRLRANRGFVGELVRAMSEVDPSISVG